MKTWPLSGFIQLSTHIQLNHNQMLTSQPGVETEQHTLWTAKQSHVILHRWTISKFLLTTILIHPSQITQHNITHSNIHTQHTIRYDETTHTAYTMMDSSMQYYDNIPYILTSILASTSAPAASNTLSTSTWPFPAALCNDVPPPYSYHKSYSRRKNEWNNHISVKRIQYMVAQLTTA